METVLSLDRDGFGCFNVITSSICGILDLIRCEHIYVRSGYTQISDALKYYMSHQSLEI
jgi:hypothetical protein